MKPFFYALFLLALLFSCTEKENPKTTIDLQYIDGYPTEVILKGQDENYFVFEDTITVNSTEDRIIEFNIMRPQEIYVVIDKKERPFFVKPNGSLIVRNSKGDGFEFDGDTAGENSFIEALYHDEELKKLSWNSGSDVSFAEFNQQLDDYFIYRNNLLNQYVSSDSYFAKYMNLEHKAFRNNAILSFVKINTPKDKLQEKFKENIDLSLSDFEQISPYWGRQVSIWYNQNYLKYLQYKKYGDDFQEVIDEKGTYQLAAETIVESYPSPIKDYLLAQWLEIYPMVYSGKYGFISPKELLLEYKDELPENIFNKQLAVLEKREKEEKRLEKGQPMPVFPFQTAEKETVDFTANTSNKLTLIDVWSSWCGPCIQSFPKVLELEKKYSDQLNVVSISVDNDFESFLKGLEKNKVPGSLKIYAENGFENDFVKHFMIKGIPRYILLDSDGNIIEAKLYFDKIEEYLNSEPSN